MCDDGSATGDGVDGRLVSSFIDSPQLHPPPENASVAVDETSLAPRDIALALLALDPGVSSNTASTGEHAPSAQPPH